MVNMGIKKYSLFLIDFLNEKFSNVLPGAFRFFMLWLLGNELIYTYFINRYLRKLNKISNFNRILIIIDVNIGDSVTHQQIVKAIRRYHRNSIIDYVCNDSGGKLIEKMKEINNTYSILKNTGAIKNKEIELINEIIKKGEYTIIINMNPYLPQKKLLNYHLAIQMYVPFGAFLIRSLKLDSENCHISYLYNSFFNLLIRSLSDKSAKRMLKKFDIPVDDCYEGNKIFIQTSSIDKSDGLLSINKLSGTKNKLFYNYSTNSKYTQMPDAVQLELLNKIVSSGNIDALLISIYPFDSKIEKLIRSRMKNLNRTKVIIIPELEIDTCAALIDGCDMLISGDTGLIHIAAAWRVSLKENYKMRNNTALVTIYGSSQPRVTGYDSYERGFLPANQLVPSKTFDAFPNCRNLSCMNKLNKVCKNVKCFDGLDIEKLYIYIDNYFYLLKSKNKN